MATPRLQSYKRLVNQYSGVPRGRILDDARASDRLIRDVEALDTGGPPDVTTTVRDIMNDIFDNHVFIGDELHIKQETSTIPGGLSDRNCQELFETLIMATQVLFQRSDWTKLDRTSKEYNTVVIVLILLARILGANKDVYSTCLDATTMLDDPCFWGTMNRWERGRLLDCVNDSLSAVGSRSVFEFGVLPMLSKEVLRLLRVRRATDPHVRHFREVTGVN